LLDTIRKDREASKAKEVKEAWTKYVSLSVVLMAIIAAVASQWSGKYSGTVSMSQAQASDQWAYYEAKSIKKHMDQLAAKELKAMQKDTEAQSLLADISRYDTESADIKIKAEALEKQRDDAKRHGSKMGAAVSSFTLAIAVASLCLVTKKKQLWYLSLFIASIAIIQMISAWYA
jgi:heme/copper-type cytochrome/quinol oxidase subunit 4